MIKVLITNGGSRFAPVWICDECEQMIDNGGLAVAVHVNRTNAEEYLSEGQLVDVKICHKGKCHDNIDEKLGGKMITGWMEFNQFLIRSGYNAGSSLDDLLKIESVHLKAGELE